SLEFAGDSRAHRTRAGGDGRHGGRPGARGIWAAGSVWGSTSGQEEMGLMRGQTLWAAGLVAAGLTLAPAAAWAQDFGIVPEGRQLFPDVLSVRAQTPDGELPDPEVPLIFGHNPAN